MALLAASLAALTGCVILGLCRVGSLGTVGMGCHHARVAEVWCCVGLCVSSLASLCGVTGIVLRVGAHQAIGAGEEFVNRTDIGCRV